MARKQTTNPKPNSFLLHHDIQPDGTLLLSIKGSITVHDGNEPLTVVKQILSDSTSISRVQLDVGQIESMDSAGIVFITALSDFCSKKDLPFEKNDITRF